MPGQSIEVFTPLARMRMPLDILDMIHGARVSIINRNFRYDQVDLRISLIDRSNVAAHGTAFRSAYPNGQIISPLVELMVELIHVPTGEVFFTAEEFTRPIDMTFVIMGMAGHLRPAGVFFNQSRVEFAPYRSFSSNEVTTRSIFTGVHGIVHNGTHFHDVPMDHWGFEQAHTAAYAGLVAAVGELNFNAEVTRGEFVQLVANTLQLPRAAVTSSGYADIPVGHVFFDGVSRARAAGLLGIWNGNNFSPNALITRQEMAAIVGTAAMLGSPARTPEFQPVSAAFMDSADISTHHLPAVQAAINYRLVTGHPNQVFAPLNPATRIETLEAVINLARAMGLLNERN
jgi:hypothetical protein